MVNELILLLDRKELQVRMDGRALRIDKPEGAVERVPLGVLGAVIVHGSPLVSCDVWRALAERNIPAVLLPARGRGASACLSAGLSNTIRLRQCQHRAASTARIEIARHLVRLKLAAQQRLLQLLTGPAGGALAARLPRFTPLGTEALHSVIERSLSSLAQTPDTATLMGFEGTAAAAWWSWLGTVLPQHWRFAGRNRRPPRDPVNALLSLTYTLLGTEMLRQVHEDGLDPALGFLHGVVPGRESLVLDLIEPLRPGADAFVLSLLDTILTPRHFTYGREDGCRLSKAGRSLYYRIWAGRRAAWLDLFPLEESPGGDAAQPDPPQQPVSAPAPSEPVVTLAGQCRRIARSVRALLDQSPLAEDG